MQTNLKKNTSFFERILQIIDYYDIKSINNFAKDFLGYSAAEKINRLKRDGTSPSYDILVDITNKFESISPDWLLTGKGEMLKADKPPDGQPLNADCQMCAIKDKLIASQEKTIAMLERQLKQCTDDQRDECQKNEKKAG